MSKRFLLVLAIIILGFGGIFLVNKDKANAPTGSSSGQTSNHVFGTGSKGVTLIEYGDFQCPACKAYFPIVKAIKEKYQADIFFQFRNFPLSSIHPNAFAGSRAAEAADKQGKFWEMHDVLYTQQVNATAEQPNPPESWNTSSKPLNYFVSYAQQLGMDGEKFTQDYADSSVNDVINADIKVAKEVGADSTPTFVLDGKKIDSNPRDLTSFEKLIDEAIAAKTKE